MEKKVYEVISKVMKVPIEKLSIESSPDTLEEWDSLSHINLIMSLEDEFNIQFSEEQIIEMLNVELIILTIKDIQNKP